RLYKGILSSKVDEWAERYSIPRTLWHVWSKNTKLTKVGASVPSAILETGVSDDDQDEMMQAIRVLNPHTGGSLEIMSQRNSLMSVLADHVFFSVRLYVVMP